MRTNREIIRIQIEKVEQSKKELLLHIKLETGRNKKRKLKSQLQFKDGILAGLRWAVESVK